MSTIRQEQVAHLLKEEVSDMLRKDLRDPRLAAVTVTDAEVSRDLSYARVYISVMGSDEDCEAALKALRKVSGFIRGEFARRAHLRIAPELEFRKDDGIQRGMRIFELLKEIEAEGDTRKTGDS